MPEADMSPVIRIWGGDRESDWNEYWTMDRVLRAKGPLVEALQSHGIAEIDICPALRLRAPVSFHRLEIFLPKPEPPEVIETLCAEIERATGRPALPMPAGTGSEFRALVSDRLLYLRQAFELWDEALPRLILGVDFDSGRHTRLRPVDPHKWRVVDHVTDAGLGRHVLPAILLEPSEKGARLLAELKTEFDDWHTKDFRARPPLNAILDYRRVLERYGVDCNESFRYGLAGGWFPIDVEEDRDWNAARDLCTTPLPDNPGDLLLDEENKPVAKYGAIFTFAAITDLYT